MFLRQGFFDGAIKPGREEAFYAFVDQQLLPVWRTFPGVMEVALFRGVSPEQGDRPYPLHTLFRYPDRETMVAALASPARQRVVELLPQLMEMFEGRVFHINSEGI